MFLKRQQPWVQATTQYSSCAINGGSKSQLQHTVNILYISNLSAGSAVSTPAAARFQGNCQQSGQHRPPDRTHRCQYIFTVFSRLRLAVGSTPGIYARRSCRNSELGAPTAASKVNVSSQTPPNRSKLYSTSRLGSEMCFAGRSRCDHIFPLKAICLSGECGKR